MEVKIGDLTMVLVEGQLMYFLYRLSLRHKLAKSVYRNINWQKIYNGNFELSEKLRQRKKSLADFIREKYVRGCDNCRQGYTVNFCFQLKLEPVSWLNSVVRNPWKVWEGFGAAGLCVVGFVHLLKGLAVPEIIKQSALEYHHKPLNLGLIVNWHRTLLTIYMQQALICNHQSAICSEWTKINGLKFKVINRN